mmetsp:Transcript_6440/g.10674  ORF Transcript_6440/g.10674 Transcript_6440/m.10674 type:complete len:1370 (-) Transcript_6440:167-4276(-)|eukprot:CAMPEP_0119013502 /NCGR_PEP_ID=MMETSP1176-20130426/8480_1 /TAXON_ID=265551 /ORGANISM="Synedropsis recta cf, Strain CCMP1620" /LENGTH=1369 /DNA_ID=CAMNT_0006966595 /DNA_START=149 /DNA_END=4258 /DNA_ORIENTATION=+
MKLSVSLLLGSILTSTVQSQVLESVVQTYFVPLPEDALFETFKIIDPETNGVINNLISIAIAANDTKIYYDHHEDKYDDGFILNVAGKQESTEIWGDGNPGNGYPPGYPDDLLLGGDTIVLMAEVPSVGRILNTTKDPVTKKFFFDGKDRIQATLPIAVTRSAYPEFPGSVSAGGVEVFDRDSWGKNFIAPVGNTTTGSTDPFSYASYYIMAGFANTNVIYPDGSTENLDVGECRVFSVREGDVVSADRNIQVDLIVGDAPSDWELRWYSQVDSSDWSSEYLSPVAESLSGTGFWFYNPATEPISINFEGGNTESGTFVVPAESSKLIVASAAADADIKILDNDVLTITTGTGSNEVTNTAKYSGVRFYADNTDDVFYGLIQVDHGLNGIEGRLYDWGFPMIPISQLTSAALVGLGYGCTDNVCDAKGERSAVWVTPQEDTIIFVDYDGNGVFDVNITLPKLSSLRLNNPTGTDMTGAIIASSTRALPNVQPDLTGIPVKIAVAWGQDPIKSGTRDKKAMDLGTAVLPLANPFVSKQVVGILNPDGSPDFRLLVDQEGDVIQYEITVSNVGFGSLDQVEVNDPLIDNTLTGPVESFPPGNGVLQRGETFVYAGTYTVTANDISTLGGGDSIIKNTATVKARTIPPVSVSVETPIALTNISGTVFEDTDGDDVGDDELEDVLITLLDSVGNIMTTTLTNEDGFYLFTDLQAGNYTVLQDNLDATYTDVTDRDGGTQNVITFDGVVGGPEYTGNNFIDERLGRIDGTVADEAGAAIVGVNVTLTDLSTGVAVTSFTDTAGEYVFDGVRPGNYTLVEVNLPSYPTSESDTDSTPDGDEFDEDTTVDDEILVTLQPAETDDGNDFVDIFGSSAPSTSPSLNPTGAPSTGPSSAPSPAPSFKPSNLDSGSPTVLRSDLPSLVPSVAPSASPTDRPSSTPSVIRSSMPSPAPSMAPSVIDSATPSFLPSVSPSYFPSLQPIPKAPTLPENCCRGQNEDSDCKVCVPFRSPDYCPRTESFPALVSERTRAFRNNATAVEDAGYWFHYLEDKIGAYLLSVAEGMPVPQIFCCVTDVTQLEDCLSSVIVPSGKKNIVVKATNFHSSQGVYVLTNFSSDAINNADASYMPELLKGMSTSYNDVISELTAKSATKIIVEEFIGDDLPVEYKFHVVDGQVAAIDIIKDRGGACPCYGVIDTQGGRLDTFGCFEPGGLEMMNDDCPAIDFLTGRMQCGPVKKDLYICDELPPIEECLMDEMVKAALKLGNAIGVYMRVDMFVVDGKFYVQEYAANHMNGLRHCAAKATGGCIDSCFLGSMWDAAGAPYGGGPAVAVPAKLAGFRALSAQAQCDLLVDVQAPDYAYNTDCSDFPARPDFLPSI